MAIPQNDRHTLLNKQNKEIMCVEEIVWREPCALKFQNKIVYVLQAACIQIIPKSERPSLNACALRDFVKANIYERDGAKALCAIVALA
jgi:hypothetical protein